MEQVDNLRRKEIPAPFSFLLSDEEPYLLMNTVFGNVPLGACLAYQLQETMFDPTQGLLVTA